MPTIHSDNQSVNGSLKNSEGFIKYSLMSSLIDVELMGGYTFDDDPTLHVYKKINFATKQITALDVYPEYHRLALGGGSFSFTLGPFVVRGEGGYYQGKYFNTSDPLVRDAVIQRDYANYMGGIDFSIFEIKNSVQFIQKRILDYNYFTREDEIQNLATYLISRDFFNETLNLQFFVYFDINNEASLIRPKLTYKYTDGLEILLGANIFTGSIGMFGQYDKNDMVYTKVAYYF